MATNWAEATSNAVGKYHTKLRDVVDNAINDIQDAVDNATNAIMTVIDEALTEIDQTIPVSDE